MANHESIPVIVDRQIEGKGIVSQMKASVAAVEAIGVDILADSFQRVISNLDSIVDATRANSTVLQIDQMIINLEIRSDVGFALVGTASAGSKTAIQVVLKQKVTP